MVPFSAEGVLGRINFPARRCTRMKPTPTARNSSRYAASGVMRFVLWEERAGAGAIAAEALMALAQLVGQFADITHDGADERQGGVGLLDGEILLSGHRFASSHRTTSFRGRWPSLDGLRGAIPAF